MPTQFALNTRNSIKQGNNKDKLDTPYIEQFKEFKKVESTQHKEVNFNDLSMEIKLMRKNTGFFTHFSLVIP